MLTKQRIREFALCLFIGLMSASVALSQTSDFTYQGRLASSGSPANGNYDFEFRLFDALTDGNPLGTQTRLGVAVTSGIFTVRLDFPSSLFDGADRFLEIGVRTAGSTGGYQQLLSRQPITGTPYSIYSLNANTATNAVNATNTTNAANATNALQLGGVNASQYVLTTDPQMTDARNPLPNSASYVQNTSVQQPSSNFNISGNDTAGGTLSGNIVNVTLPSGKPMREVRVELLDIFTNTTRTTMTNGEGFYSFEELEVNHFYIIKAERKQYVFTPENYTFELSSSRDDINFMGNKLHHQ